MLLCFIKFLNNWNAQNCPFVTLLETGTNVASTADKYGVINCAEQTQVTNIRASEAQSRRRGASLASIFVGWICKAQLITSLFQLVMRCLTFYVVGRKSTCGRLNNLRRSVK